MNIFILDSRPAVAAQMLCNRHVVKMIVESAQIMATVHHRYGSSATYRSTHEHHPCTIWTGASAQNYAWLLAHTKAMCREYTLRYEKTHATQHYVFGELHALPPGIPFLGQTPFAQAMPDQYRDIDPVLAYRRYYLGAKKDICKWTNRDVPAWFEYQQPELEV